MRNLILSIINNIPQNYLQCDADKKKFVVLKIGLLLAINSFEERSAIKANSDKKGMVDLKKALSTGMDDEINFTQKISKVRKIIDDLNWSFLASKFGLYNYNLYKTLVTVYETTQNAGLLEILDLLLTNDKQLKLSNEQINVLKKNLKKKGDEADSYASLITLYKNESELARANDKLTKKVQVLIKKNEYLAQENQQLKDYVAKQEQEIASLKSQIAVLNANLTHYANNMFRLDEKIDTLVNENAMLKTTNLNLEIRLKTIENKLNHQPKPHRRNPKVPIHSKPPLKKCDKGPKMMQPDPVKDTAFANSTNPPGMPATHKI